jgi:transcriptional regulator with XRE-family HTH domain
VANKAQDRDAHPMREDRDKVAKAFGAALRHVRESKQLSQEELALSADVDRTFVSRAERGIRQPALATVISLSAALQVPAAELIALTEALLSQPKASHRKPARGSTKR